MSFYNIKGWPYPTIVSYNEKRSSLLRVIDVNSEVVGLAPEIDFGQKLTKQWSFFQVPEGF
jgi:hypothetical protein